MAAEIDRIKALADLLGDDDDEDDLFGAKRDHGLVSEKRHVFEKKPVMDPPSSTVAKTWSAREPTPKSKTYGITKDPRQNEILREMRRLPSFQKRAGPTHPNELASKLSLHLKNHADPIHRDDDTVQVLGDSADEKSSSDEETDKTPVFGKPKTFGAAGGEVDTDHVPNVRERASAILQWKLWEKGQANNGHRRALEWSALADRRDVPRGSPSANDGDDEGTRVNFASKGRGKNDKPPSFLKHFEPSRDDENHVNGVNTTPRNGNRPPSPRNAALATGVLSPRAAGSIPSPRNKSNEPKTDNHRDFKPSGTHGKPSFLSHFEAFRHDNDENDDEHLDNRRNLGRGSNNGHPKRDAEHRTATNKTKDGLRRGKPPMSPLTPRTNKTTGKSRQETRSDDDERNSTPRERHVVDRRMEEKANPSNEDPAETNPMDATDCNDDYDMRNDFPRQTRPEERAKQKTTLESTDAHAATDAVLSPKRTNDGPSPADEGDQKQVLDDHDDDVGEIMEEALRFLRYGNEENLNRADDPTSNDRELEVDCIDMDVDPQKQWSELSPLPTFRDHRRPITIDDCDEELLSAQQLAKALDDLLLDSQSTVPDDGDSCVMSVTSLQESPCHETSSQHERHGVKDAPTSDETGDNQHAVDVSGLVETPRDDNGWSNWGGDSKDDVGADVDVNEFFPTTFDGVACLSRNSSDDSPALDGDGSQFLPSARDENVDDTFFPYSFGEVKAPQFRPKKSTESVKASANLVCEKKRPKIKICINGAPEFNLNNNDQHVFKEDVFFFSQA